VERFKRFKPELTIVEASHRLALSEGQKRTERKKWGMKLPKFRLAVSIVILVIASLTVYFLVQDIYRLQKEYNQIWAQYPHSIPIEVYPMIMEKLEEIQNMINLREAAVVLVVAATAVALLVLNKHKLFKEKRVAPALTLLPVSFFQKSTVHARTS